MRDERWDEGTMPGESNDAAVIRIHVTVSGLVQGVGFRYFAYQSARRCGVTGWVRNLLDGDVEAEAQGTREQVEDFVGRLRVGPRWARVAHVEVSRIGVEGETAFRVLR